MGQIVFWSNCPSGILFDTQSLGTLCTSCCYCDIQSRIWRFYYSGQPPNSFVSTKADGWVDLRCAVCAGCVWCHPSLTHPFPNTEAHADRAASREFNEQSITPSCEPLFMLQCIRCMPSIKSSLACSVQGSYLSLGTIRTPEQWIYAGSMLGGAIVLLGAYYAYIIATDANKRKKYRKALEEVTKMS